MPLQAGSPSYSVLKMMFNAPVRYFLYVISFREFPHTSVTTEMYSFSWKVNGVGPLFHENISCAVINVQSIADGQCPDYMNLARVPAQTLTRKKQESELLLSPFIRIIKV